MPFVGPNLWTPRQKPGPHAVLDWNHPLAKGLVFFAVPGGCHRRDLVSGGLGTIFNNATLNGGGGVFGSAFATVSGSQGGIYWPLSTQVQTATGDFTLVVIANLTSLGNFSTLLSIPYRSSGAWTSPFAALSLVRNGTTSIGSLLVGNAAGSQLEADSASGYLHNTDGWMAYGFSRAGGTATFYRQGANFSSTTLSTNAIYYGNNTGGTFGPTLLNDSGVPTQSGNQPVGQAALAALWNRALSAAEMLQMSCAPYQFLVEPQNPIRSIYLLGQASAAPAAPKLRIMDGYGGVFS